MECASRGAEAWQRRRRYFQASEGDARPAQQVSEAEEEGSRTEAEVQRPLVVALGESAVHTSPSHHYAHLRSLLGFPLLRSSRLFFSRFSLFFCHYHCRYLYWRFLLCFGFLFKFRYYLQCFIWRIFYSFGSALAWIDECEESSPASAHPS